MTATAAGRVVLTFDIDDTGVVQGIGGISKRVKSESEKVVAYGKQLSGYGESMTKYLTLPIVGVGAAALKVGTDFGSAMNAIKGVLQPTNAQMERIRATAIQMGADTVFSATESAEAMLELGKAGFDTDTAIASVDEVLQLAAASGMSMADSASLAARALNAFDLEASSLGHVNDVLAAAVNRTSLEIQDMQIAFGYVGPVARGFGMSIETVSAALGIMRNNGVAAETTGRALREGFSRLVNPVKAVRDVMKELGIESFKTADGSMMPLADIVGLLQSRGLTAGQALKMFGYAAGPGMYALVSKGKPALVELTQELERSDGAAKAMADAMMEGLPGAAERLKGSVETAFLSVSGVIEPTAIMVMDKLGGMADVVTGVVVPAFAGLPPEVQAGAIALVGLVAAAGPALMIAGKLVQAWGLVSGALGISGFAGAAALAAKSVTVVGVAFAGWQIGRWIGELTGLTGVVQRLTEATFDLRNTAEPVESQQRTINQAIALGADKAVTFAQALQFLKDRAASLHGQWQANTKAFTDEAAALADSIAGLKARGFTAAQIAEQFGSATVSLRDRAKNLGVQLSQLPASVLEVAYAFEEQAQASGHAAMSTDDLKAANKAAKEAAEDADEAAKRQRDTLKALGLITAGDVVEAITNYNEALELAAAQGQRAFVPAAVAVMAKLKALRVDAVAAGLSVEDLDREIAELRAVIPSVPIPTLTTAIGRLGDDTGILAARFGVVTGEMLATQTQATLTAGAFAYFGQRTRTELDQTAQDALVQFERMRASGVATPEALQAAWEKVLEAERRGRKQSIPIWKAWADQVLAIGKSTLRSFTDQIVGINSRLNEEKKRAADDAREQHARVEQDARESVSRAQESAREEYDQTRDHAQETYDADLAALDETYGSKLALAEGNHQAIKNLENWYANERQRLEDEKTAKIVEADKAMNDAIAAAAQEATEKVATSHAEMDAAIEAAAHPWRDRMIEIWESLKTGVKDILSQILSDFVGNFLGGMLQGLNGWARQAGSIFSQVLGMGGSAGVGGMLSPGVLTAGGASGGAGAVGGAGAAGTIGAVSTFAAGLVAPLVIGRLVNPGAGTPLDYVSEGEARGAAEAYFGPAYEQYFDTGFDWSTVLPGAIPGLAEGGIVPASAGGMLARLAEAGRPELIAPLPPGFDLAETLESLKQGYRDRRADRGTIDNRIVIDGREIARVVTAYQVDEWRLAGVTT